MQLGAFPPHTEPDLVDRLAAVWQEWRRDNGLWCKEELERILEQWPWSKEASDFYGLVCSKTRHVFSLIAMKRLHEWFALHQVAKGQPYVAGEELVRFRIMRDLLAGWLQGHRHRYLGGAYRPQRVYPWTWRKKIKPWADLADIGGQMGEMAALWARLPGMRRCTMFELAGANCRAGRFWYGSKDSRLAYVEALAEELPARSGSVDIAVVSGILEHVLEPERVVREAERILRPGGLLLVQVPYGGMEGPPNPEADKLSFRGHVRSINPYDYLEGPFVTVQYIRYTGDVAYSHACVGECGDWLVAWEKP